MPREREYETPAEKQRAYRERLRTDQEHAVEREAAVERGRLLGTGEADSRRETEPARSQRIQRAMAYAAWEHDEQPKEPGSQPSLGSAQRYRAEFGLGDPPVMPSLERLTPRP